MKNIKKYITVILSALLLCVMFCSCSQSTPSVLTETTTSETETVIPTTTTIHTIIEKTTQTEDVTKSAEETVKQYSELYSTTETFRDKYISQKYLLIGEENIVELYAINSISQTKVIKQNNIERVENNTVNDFTEIKIYDKTNQNISIMVEPEKADEILKLLDTSK